MIIEYRQKVQDLFNTVQQLKSQNKQSEPDYQEVFAELQRNWEILKDLESQQEKNKLFEEKAISIDPNSHNLGTSTAATTSLPYQSHLSQQQQQIIPTKPIWSESQLYQLQHQIQAYKYLVNNQEVPENVLNKMLLMQPDDWAYKRELIHQNTQRLYEEKFENNSYLNIHDLWDYINRKLQNEGENHAKVLSESSYIQSYLQHLNETDEISAMKEELLHVINDEQAPEDEKKNADLTLKMLQIRPLQKEIREKVLHRYLSNKIALQNFKAQTAGDVLYERQLVDREFYKRAKVYQSTKKEARTLDRFEQQMRSGQELRKKTRHKEFLNEILIHTKEFFEFHKRKQNFIRKKAQMIKSNLESKEKKDLQMAQKQEIQRIKALKENNIEDYINLITTQKNSRLLQILEQTHKYLEQLGAKVGLQKNENLLVKKQVNQKQAEEDIEGGSGQPGKSEESKSRQGAGNDLEAVQVDSFGNPILKENNNPTDFSDMTDAERIKQNLKSGSKIYYSITHTIQEVIKEQPKMLKGVLLKSYQMIGLNWMVSLYNNNLNGILADEMGLGKTIQTISLFAHLIESKGCEGPFLIVVPLTTISNWSMEFDKWAPDIRKIIYKGKKHERPLLAAHLKNDKFHVVLTTYEYILNDRSTLCKISWQYIIVDEGHRMKNSKSKFALTLGQQYNSAHRILLTGTPLQNNLSELWALLNFLLPKIFSSCDEFQKWFDKPLSRIHPVTSCKNEKQAFELSEEEQLLIINRLHQVLRPFLLRRVKVEVETELPDKIEKVIKVDLSAWQKIVYKGIQENGTLARDPSTGKIGNYALRNTVMQLRKICNHPYLFLDYLEEEDMKDNIYRSSGKFELLDRILPKLIRTNHKTLIFSQFTQVMDILKKFFEFKGISHLRLDGGTKADDRKAILEQFNEGNFQVFLLSTRAGGHGLNLQIADTVIIFDSDWNPQMDEQAKDRAHRIGQKKEVRVYRLITATKIEEGILSKATQKKELDAKIIQAGMFNAQASEMDRQKRLEDLIRKDYEEEDDQEECEIPNDDQINLLLKRDDEEYEIFTKMDQQRYIDEGKDEILERIVSRMEKRKSININNINYRLMQEWEVPDWVKQKPEDPSKLIGEYGIGKRQRKQVNYNDEMSERQWLSIIEAGGDVNQEIEKRKKKRLEQQQSTMTHILLDPEEESPSDGNIFQGKQKRRKLDNMSGENNNEMYELSPEGEGEDYGIEENDESSGNNNQRYQMEGDMNQENNNNNEYSDKVMIRGSKKEGITIQIRKCVDPELQNLGEQRNPGMNDQQEEEDEDDYGNESNQDANMEDGEIDEQEEEKMDNQGSFSTDQNAAMQRMVDCTTKQGGGGKSKHKQGVFCGVITNNDQTSNESQNQSNAIVSSGVGSGGNTQRVTRKSGREQK